MRSVVALSSLALACVLAASRVAAQPSADPCSLLSPDDVSQVLGIKSLPGRPWLGTSKVSCFFSADAGFDLATRSVTVQVITPAAFDFGKQLSSRGPLAGKGAGVGDDSYYVSVGSYAKLGVRKGARAFSLTVTPGPGKDTPEHLGELESKLAVKVVARL